MASVNNGPKIEPFKAESTQEKPAASGPSGPPKAASGPSGAAPSIQNGPSGDQFSGSGDIFSGTLTAPAKAGNAVNTPAGASGPGASGATGPSGVGSASGPSGVSKPGQAEQTGFIIPAASGPLGASGPSGAGASAASGPSGASGTSTLTITKDDQNGTEKVNTALAQIANDSEGQKLLQQAKAKGYHIEISGASNGASTTYTDSKTIIIDTNGKGLDAYNLTAVVAHELVHAATDDNGNSFVEEVTATTLGNHIAKRADGKTETPEEEAAEYKRIYADYKNAAYRPDAPNYQLQFMYENSKDNGIRDTLGAMGVDVSNYKEVAIPALSIHQVTFDQFDAAITGVQDKKISLNDIQKMKTGTGSNADLARILEMNYNDIAGADGIIDIYDLSIVP
jgi:hypothetical protein